MSLCLAILCRPRQLTRKLMSPVSVSLWTSLCLRPVLPGWGGEAVPIHALHAGGQRPAAKIRRFVDFLAARLPRDGWRA